MSMDIEAFCLRYHIENYTISPDGFIDVDGDVPIDSLPFNMTRLPSGIQFGHVSGDFVIGINRLIYLNGFPLSVGGSFLGQIYNISPIDENFDILYRYEHDDLLVYYLRDAYHSYCIRRNRIDVINELIS